MSASMTLAKPDGAQLQEIFERVAAGKAKLEVSKVRCWLTQANLAGVRGRGAGEGGGVKRLQARSGALVKELWPHGSQL